MSGRAPGPPPTPLRRLRPGLAALTLLAVAAGLAALTPAAAQTPGPPDAGCPALTSAVGDVRASLEGPPGCSVGSPMVLHWALTGPAPRRPPLKVTTSSRKDPDTGKVVASKRVSDPSWSELGRRWADDGRLEYLVVSAPDTVRLEGDGFYVVPPGAKLPFAADLDPTRLRIVYPLSLPESRNDAALTLHGFRAGALPLAAYRVSATASGQVIGQQRILAADYELRDLQAVVIVQDRVTPEPAQHVWLSRDGRWRLRDYGARFELYNAATDGLLLRIAGVHPRFSPTGRFILYETAENLVVLDALAGLEVFRSPTDDLASVSTVAQDTYLAVQGSGWGAFSLIPLLVDRAPPPEDAGDDAESDILDPTIVDDRCHACVVLARSLTLRYAEGGFAYSVARSDVAHYESLIAPEVRFPTLQPARLKAAPQAPSPAPLATLWAIHDPYHEVPAPESFSLAAAAGGLQADPLQGTPVLRDVGVVGPRETATSPAEKIAQDLSGLGLALAPAVTISHKPRRVWTFAGASTKAKNGPYARYRAEMTAWLPTPVGDNADYEAALISKDETPGPAEGIAARHAEFWSWARGDTTVQVAAFSDANYGNAGFVDATLCVFESRTATRRLTRSLCSGGEEGDLGFESKTDLDLLVAPLSADETLIVDRKAQQAYAWDLKGQRVSPVDLPLTQLSQAAEMRVSADGTRIVQLNRDGQFFVYDRASKTLVLAGLYVDDEFVAYTPDGYYDASPEGGHYVYRYFPGLGEHFAFNEFAALYERPDIIRQVAAGGAPPPPPAALTAPPTVTFSIAPQSGAPGVFKVTGEAQGPRLKTLRLFLDGSPVREDALSGSRQAFGGRVETPAGLHWITAVAYNDLGFASLPKSARADAEGGRPKGTLRFVGVGIDTYPNLPGARLAFARRDLELLDAALTRGPTPTPGPPAPAKRAAKSMPARKPAPHAKADVNLLASTAAVQAAREYGKVDTTLILDEAATAAGVLEGLRSAVQRTGPDDTLMVSFAGHGLKGEDGRFYFVTVDAAPGRLAQTALPWTKIAEVLAQSRGRVIVLLDACHAGVASQDAVTPNDAYAAELQQRGKAGMVILAASKGRQFSQENAKLAGGHGLFSYAVAQALGAQRAAADRDKDGVIELDELYRYVKTWVAEATRGTAHPQTPWLSHDEFVGQVPVE